MMISWDMINCTESGGYKKLTKQVETTNKWVFLTGLTIKNRSFFCLVLWVPQETLESLKCGCLMMFVSPKSRDQRNVTPFLVQGLSLKHRSFSWADWWWKWSKCAYVVWCFPGVFNVFFSVIKHGLLEKTDLVGRLSQLQTFISIYVPQRPSSFFCFRAIPSTQYFPPSLYPMKSTKISSHII